MGKPAVMPIMLLLLVAACGDPEAQPTPNSLASADILTEPDGSHVDIAPLDDPGLEVTVYWVGYRFNPGNGLPPLKLDFVAGPSASGGGPPDSQGELQYRIADADTPTTGVTLRYWSRADWEKWAERDPAADDFAAVFHMFWNSPCAQADEVQVEGGEAQIYSSYQVLADLTESDCPDSSFDRFVGHAFFGDTVVTVNAPAYVEPATGSPYPAPYNSAEGVRAILRALQPRKPVSDPTPLPTPVADIANPGSLVLQEADLPGRYRYGDDGCAPDRDCFTGPTKLGAEGGYEELSAAAGMVHWYAHQFEHAGFNSEGTPDPREEPPVILSQILICADRCDPAAILDRGADLLVYSGYTDAEVVSFPLNLGDDARIYGVDALVFGQVEPGVAAVWRQGPTVSLVAIGGVDGEHGHRIAIDLARAQDARVARALAE